MAQGLLLNLNVLIVYGDKGQLTKLHVAIFTLLNWTDIVMIFLLKTLKMPTNLPSVFKCI